MQRIRCICTKRVAKVPRVLAESKVAPLNNTALAPLYACIYMQLGGCGSDAESTHYCGCETARTNGLGSYSAPACTTRLTIFIRARTNADASACVFPFSDSPQKIEKNCAYITLEYTPLWIRIRRGPRQAKQKVHHRAREFGFGSFTGPYLKPYLLYIYIQDFVGPLSVPASS